MKLINAFGRRKAGRDGLQSMCKECLAKKRKTSNIEKARERNRKWKRNNPEKVREARRRYNKSHYERNKQLVQKWLRLHPGKVRLYLATAYKKKMSTARGRLEHSIKCSISESLHGNKGGRHWEAIVGYTLDQLRKHIERKLESGMTWDNYGKNGWHIDHKIPISAFNFHSPDDLDFKRCWALKNLRPMWADDNLRKGAKIEKPFQPSLAMAV